MRRTFCALQRPRQSRSDQFDKRRYLLQKLRRKLFQLRNDRFGNRSQFSHCAIKRSRRLLRLDNIAVYLSVLLRRVRIKPVQRFCNQRLPFLFGRAFIKAGLKFIFRNARPIQGICKPARYLSGFRRFVRRLGQVFDRQAVAESRVNARRYVRPRRKLLFVVRELCKVGGGFGRLSVVAKNAVKLRVCVLRIFCRMPRRCEACFQLPHIFACFACAFRKPQKRARRRADRRAHCGNARADCLSYFSHGVADAFPIDL